MRRELFSFPHIDSYPAMLFAGFIGGWLMARWRAKQDGIDPRHVDNLTLLIAIFSLVGARLFSWMFYQPKNSSLIDNFKLWGGGGLVLYGGVLFAILCVVIYAPLRQLSILKLGDAFAPALALGLAFGRVGCFLAGCCWGDVCGSTAEIRNLNPTQLLQVQTFPRLCPPGFPGAVTFPPDTGAFLQHSRLGLLGPGATRSLPVHPVQLYESAGALLLCLALNAVYRRRRHPGEILCGCGVGYALIRFSVEFVRADNPLSYFGLTLSQAISLLIGLGSATLWLWLRREIGVSPDTSPAPVPNLE